MGEVHTPDRIWAWEIDHEDMPPNGYYATAEVDDSTPYLRATPAREAAEDLVDALEGFNPRLIGSGPSLSHEALDAAWQKARVVLARVKGGAA